MKEQKRRRGILRKEPDRMSKIAKIPLILLGIALGFFVVTFTIYFFNLDMKATAMLEPLLEKWYDSREHDQYI